MFELPPLPYAKDALQPYLSEETLTFHYEKHHLTYVNNLNTLLAQDPLANASLETIILQSTGKIFNNAAQVWNHTFYWEGLTPHSPLTPSGLLAQAIDQQFGSVATFKTRFQESALALFGSGWTWLEKDATGQLTISNTSNADLPMKHNKQALLACDVWEHAYYIDYRNARVTYLDNFWKLVNWDFVAKNFAN